MNKLENTPGSKGQRAIIAWVVLFVAVGLIAIMFASKYATLEGMFDEPRVGVEGFSFFEFHDGKVTLVTEEFRKPWGTYARKNGTWFWTIPEGDEFRMEASLTELRVFSPKGTEESFQRLFLHPRSMVTGSGKKLKYSKP